MLKICFTGTNIQHINGYVPCNIRINAVWLLILIITNWITYYFLFCDKKLFYKNNLNNLTQLQIWCRSTFTIKKKQIKKLFVYIQFCKKKKTITYISVSCIMRANFRNLKTDVKITLFHLLKYRPLT